MSEIQFGRVVSLIRDRAIGRDFRLGLDAIEPGTGRLVSEPGVDFEGEGIAFTAGDVLFGKLRPYLAKVWCADTAGAAVGDFHVYRPKANILLPTYLKYLLLGHKFLDPVISSVFGAKMPRADWDFIRTVPVHVPSIDEQASVVEHLDRETAKIDSLLQEQMALVEVLRERRAAVVFRAVTKGIDASVALVDSGVDWLGFVPNHWTVTSLRRVGRFLTGTTPPGASEESFDSDGDVGWARPEDLQRRVVPTKRLSKVGESEVRVVRDAVLICGIGATVGKVGFAEGRCSSNQQLTALVTSQCGAFWYYALLAARAKLVGLSTGNTLPILNNERLAQLRVAIPPVDEQQRIAQYLDEQAGKIDGLIAEAEALVAVAKERRSALITAAVSAQVEAKGEVA